MKFIDVPETHWAYEAIEELSKLGVLNGYPDNTFKPEEQVTRAELAAVISRILEV